MRLQEFWYIAAQSHELRASPLARRVLGEPLVLFRGTDGRPAALLDRCAHRNMALSRGRVVEGCLECPYHGWRYETDGACAHIPSLSAGETRPRHLTVRSLPTLEQDGYLWVYPGERVPEALPPRFPHRGEHGWTTFTLRNRFQAGALACLENFLDCPHTVYVHRGWFRSAQAREVRARLTCTATSVEAEFFEERDAESVVSRLLFPAAGRLVHTDRFLMPTTSRVDYSFGPDRHFIITSQCTPVGEDETDVYTVITFRFGRIAPLVRLVFEPLSRRIIRQDLAILKAQTDQLRLFGGPHFTSVESDLIGPQIQRLWREAEKREGAAPAVSREVVLRF